MASPLGLIAPSLAARRTRPAGEVLNPPITRAVVVTGVPDGWEPVSGGGLTVNAISVVGRTTGRRNIQVSFTDRPAPGTPSWIPFAGPSGATYRQPAGASQAAVVWGGPTSAPPVVVLPEQPPISDTDPRPAPITGSLDVYGLLPTDAVTIDGVTAVPTMDGAIARFTVSSGSHTLRVVRPNAAPVTQQVTVTPPQTAFVYLSFAAPPPPASDTLGWLALLAGVGGVVWWASKQ